MPETSLTFDKLDYQIIQELRKDARAPASEIARVVDAHPRTVRNRIDRLVELGAARLTAVITPQVFGYMTAADIFIEVDPEREKEIVALFMGMSEVSYLAYGQGTRDISLEVRFKDNAEFYDFLRHQLPEIPGVKVTGYALVPKIMRNIDEWMPREEDFGKGQKPGSSD
ncbi:MAG: Lrp/AsnC family transcriptional regulator [Anaerolineae bacterium]|nr:Lrp/AsnC family transcriptional regulator [Anaerolineae bacterium]